MRIILTILSVFGVIAILIGLFGGRSPEGRGPLWRTYLVQVGVVSWIMLPVSLGGGIWVAAMVVMGVVVLIEADGVRAMGRPAGPQLSLPVRSLLGLAYPGLGVASLLALGLEADGLLHVFFLFAVTEIQDSASLLAGKFWGRKLIFPRLSPKKTWTGTMAGVGGAIGAALVAGAVAPLRPPALTLLVGLMIGSAGLAGDLLASAMKRRAGVKDFSAIVPTMGGVLDVYDSLIFAAPFYLILVWVGL